uniref:Leucine-rich pentatricopeptide repeat containing n=1 Tax=Xiphophorus couchianus TaxID=32473 RepID=A0A3B5M2Q6_9TELE
VISSTAACPATGARTTPPAPRSFTRSLSCRKNMAALLRSARLLKFSPSGLLQIPGSRRSGAPLSRLYSGVLVGRSTGVCSRQLGRVSDSLEIYSVCVRSYAVATEQKDEIGLAVRSKQAQQFDWALTKLDSSVRRTGRITKTLLMRIFHDICRTGYPSSNHALLLLRSCGSLLPEVPMEERNDLKLNLGIIFFDIYDVSHYNALLKVYLQNEFKFSPTDFLAKMEAANVQPNRVTYQRLIAAYCQNGDIEGASTILGFMKSKDLPITEAVFSSLITGHSRAGDIESAANILSVMRGAGVEPSPDTYVTLLNAYGEKGDLESMKKTLEAAESADCSLMDRDIMQVILTLAKAGQQQHIPEMIERLRHERGYIPDAMNLCLSLITQGHEDTAFSLLKTFPTLQSETNDSSILGNFFLRHCVNMDTALEKVVRYCKELQELNLHTSSFTFTLSCALEAQKLGMSLELMKTVKEQNLPVRPHYFWPLLTQPLKENNIFSIIQILLGVSPDLETLATYILPVFPSLEAALKTLQDSGVSVDSEAFVCAEIRTLAASNLAKVYTLSKSTHIDSNGVFNKMLKLFTFHAHLAVFVILTFEFLSIFFLQNVTISLNIYRGIKNLLEAYHCPELIKVQIRTHITSVSKVDFVKLFHHDENRVLALERKLAELKAENKPLSSILKQTIHALSAEENLQRALELKQQHEDDMSVGAYATLIGLCCRHNNTEEALNLKRELSRKDSLVTLDPIKYMALIKTLSLNDKVEEAVDILKEMKEKDVMLNDSHITSVFHMLNTVAAKGGIPTVRRLQDTIFTLGLAKPTANLCSPVVTFYLESKDASGALDALLECHKLYNQLPRIHDVIVALVEKGDTDLLQKVTDFVSQERGEMMMLYDLFFAFLQTGRYREARKIIETPGLRAKPGRLQWFGEKCIASNQMGALEQMVEMTSKLFECDRDEMYSYILRLCKETNDWQKAEATWTKMQEENVIPRESTLRLLADILKSNRQEVPFEVPEVKLQSQPPPLEAERSDRYQGRLLTLCKKGKAKEALGVVKEVDEKGVVLGGLSYDHVIRALLAQGHIEDAMVVKQLAQSHLPGFKLSEIANNLLIISYKALEKLKSMLQLDHVPSHLAITRLVQALGNQGDVAGIQEVESVAKTLGTNVNLSSMVFVNNTALAHIAKGDVESAVELLEGIYMSPDSSNPSMSFVFRKVLESGNDKALDKLSAMAERLANHFACYRPVSDLFLLLLDMDKVEDAKFLLARFNVLAEQKEMLLSFVAQSAQSPGQVRKIKNLLSLVPDVAEKEIVYSYLMKCHALDKDLPSGKALYEQMQREGVVTDNLFLKRLAVLYREAGETAPFPEPPVSERRADPNQNSKTWDISVENTEDFYTFLFI